MKAYGTTAPWYQARKADRNYDGSRCTRKALTLATHRAARKRARQAAKIEAKQ